MINQQTVMKSGAEKCWRERVHHCVSRGGQIVFLACVEMSQIFLRRVDLPQLSRLVNHRTVS